MFPFPFFEKHSKECCSFNDVDKRLHQISSNGKITTYPNQNPLEVDPDRVVFRRGEHFLQRLERYKTEVALRHGKRKLTSKPRFLTGAGTCFNEVEQIMPTPRVKYHELEDILSSNDVPDVESVPVDTSSLNIFMGQLTIGGGHENTPSHQSRELNLDSVYPSDTPSHSIQQEELDNIKIRTVPRPESSKANGSARKSTTAQLRKPKNIRRHSESRTVEMERGERNIPYISPHHRDSLNVVYLSPSQFRHDSTMQQQMRALSTNNRPKGSVRRRLSAGNADGMAEWFEAEYDETCENFVVDFKTPPDLAENGSPDGENTSQGRTRAMSVSSRRPYMQGMGMSMNMNMGIAFTRESIVGEQPVVHEHPLDLVYFSKGKQAPFSSVNTFFQPKKSPSCSGTPDIKQEHMESFVSPLSNGELEEGSPVKTPDRSPPHSPNASPPRSPESHIVHKLTKASVDHYVPTEDSPFSATPPDPSLPPTQPALPIPTLPTMPLPPPLLLPELKYEEMHPPQPPDSEQSELVDADDGNSISQDVSDAMKSLEFPAVVVKENIAI